MFMFQEGRDLGPETLEFGSSSKRRKIGRKQKLSYKVSYNLAIMTIFLFLQIQDVHV